MLLCTILHSVPIHICDSYVYLHLLLHAVYILQVLTANVDISTLGNIQKVTDSYTTTICNNIFETAATIIHHNNYVNMTLK